MADPPGEPVGEDVVVAWLVETMLTGGSAMVHDVPFGLSGLCADGYHVEGGYRRDGHHRDDLATTIRVYSPLVVGAKTGRSHHLRLGR